MFDLIVKGGTLPDGRVTDVGIRADRIVAVEDLGAAEAGRSSTPPAIWSARPLSIRISIWMRP